jgi:hypothetical protein
VNIGRELAGKSLRGVRFACAAGWLDVGDGLWQYSPPRFAGVDHSMPNPAPDLLVRVHSASDADLLWIL